MRVPLCVCVGGGGGYALRTVYEDEILHFITTFIII